MRLPGPGGPSSLASWRTRSYCWLKRKHDPAGCQLSTIYGLQFSSSAREREGWAATGAGLDRKQRSRRWLRLDIGSDLGGSAAQSVILMVIVVALTAFQFRYVEKKVHY